MSLTHALTRLPPHQLFIEQRGSHTVLRRASTNSPFCSLVLKWVIDAKAAKYYQIVQHYTFPAAKWISGDEEVKKRLKDMKIDVPEGDLGPKDVVNIGMAIEEHLFQKMRFDRAMQNVEFKEALINYAFNPNEDYEKQVLKLHDEFLAMRRYRK